MSESWNVFDAPAPLPARVREAAEGQRQAQLDLTRAAFGSGAGAAWLKARTAREMAQPSYVPGTSHDQAAYAEGRKAVFREIETELAQQEGQG
jgi:hypothetical protein